jgi:GNAT superfamily N-acetyltransferase
VSEERQSALSISNTRPDKIGCYRLKDDEYITYNPNHPTITAPRCFHFVLYKGIEIVSVTMIEFLDNTTAALRTVATDKPYQHQGFGRQMIKLLEKWMKGKGIKVVIVRWNLMINQLRLI